MSAPTLATRGTTNQNARGSSYDRAARRTYLLKTYGDGVTCRCYRCGLVLDASTVTVDRIVPGQRGGGYVRTNIRPACGPCNSETGGALSAPRTRSQIGRASRDKGARFERAVATAVRPWWPQVRRSRDNGSVMTSDTGDLAGTHEGLFWSLKDVAAARTEPPALIAGWLAEASVKGDGRTPLVVVKRAGHADPLMSWCWLLLDDLIGLTAGDWCLPYPAPVRMELRHALDLLAAAGYAAVPDLEEK